MYINEYDEKGAVTSSIVIGVASWSPDYRKNAPCQDGHKVEFTSITAIATWLESLAPAAKKLLPEGFSLKRKA